MILSSIFVVVLLIVFVTIPYSIDKEEVKALSPDERKTYKIKLFVNYVISVLFGVIDGLVLHIPAAIAAIIMVFMLIYYVFEGLWFDREDRRTPVKWFVHFGLLVVPLFVFMAVAARIPIGLVHRLPVFIFGLFLGWSIFTAIKELVDDKGWKRLWYIIPGILLLLVILWVGFWTVGIDVKAGLTGLVKSTVETVTSPFKAIAITEDAEDAEDAEEAEAAAEDAEAGETTDAEASVEDEEAEIVTEEAEAEEIAEAEDVVTPEELDALDHLAVALSPEELEELTVKKYGSISYVFLQSSLSPHDKGRTEATGFSDALTYGFKSKDEVERFQELEEEILRNPVYGITVVNALRGKTIGGKTIETFNPWMTEMLDKAKKGGVSYWLEHRDDSDTIYVKDEYREYAATLCTWLERLVSRGVYSWQTSENWCLNEGAKNDGRKGVKATYQYKKEALIFSYVGKNGSNLFTMGINIHDKRPEFYGSNSGKNSTSYDPNTTPEKTAPKTDPGDTPGNGDDPGEDDPGKKDPAKASTVNTEPNDNSGAGRNTNNGAGSKNAPDDKSDNSNHGSKEDYDKNIENLKETNETQKTGKDDNKPSTPSGGAKVDNNGDKGTGNGGINDPTPKQDKAKEADTGKPINDKPGEAWGGPPD